MTDDTIRGSCFDGNGSDDLCFFDNSTNKSYIYSLCKEILTREIGSPGVRIWDTAILIPNLLFLLFLLVKFRRIRTKLLSTGSPVFLVFYVMVYASATLGVFRCIVSMAISMSSARSEVLVKILWIFLSFILLSMEFSVLFFGLLFGHLDSRTSIKRVVAATAVITVVYTILQAAFEFSSQDIHFETESGNVVLFSHGGCFFIIISSSLLLCVYAAIFILPFTPLRHIFLLPKKRRFYAYCAFLLLLDALLVIGSALLLNDILDGMCVIDAASYTYFAFYAPLMYAAFLRGYAAINNSALYFSYVAQKNFPGQISSVSNLNESYGTAEWFDENTPSTADVWSNVDSSSDVNTVPVVDTSHSQSRFQFIRQLSIPTAIRV